MSQSDAAIALGMRIHRQAKERSLERPRPPVPDESEMLTLLKRLDRYFDTHPIRLDLRIAIKRAVKG